MSKDNDTSLDVAGVDTKYIIENCKEKRNMCGIEICMIQTIPCKFLVERGKCPKVEFAGKILI